MTDLEKAKSLLVEKNTCVLVRGEKIYTSTKSGIAPMMDFISQGVDLKGFSAADKIVGKAAAMLFSLAQVRSLHAVVLSKAGLAVLRENKIDVTYDMLVENIINRSGTGICPMEAAVKDEKDLKAGYEKLKQKLDLMRKTGGNMKPLTELSKKIFEANKQKGFWDKERPFSEVIALCHTELSEAFEEYRHKEKLPNNGMYYYSDKQGNKHEKLDKEKTYKPEGMASEMIDEIIRVLDWCGSENLDVDKLIEEKLNYNQSRPYKHGKNC